MTKSKITLYTSPTQKLIIYIDPEKQGQEACLCKIVNSQNKFSPEEALQSIEPLPFSEVTSEEQLASFASSVSTVDEFIPPPQLIERPKQLTPQESNSEDYISSTETPENESSQQVNDNVDENETSAKMPSRGKTQKINFNLETPESSVLSLKPHNRRLSINSTHSKSGNRIEVDESFIESVACIIEANNLETRKEKLDELLNNISGVKVGELSKAKDEAKLGCWPSFKFSKKRKVAITPREPTPQRVASVPYFNRSFYRYSLKSRIEGLTFQPHRVYRYGEQGSGFQAKKGSQDFYELRDQCLQRGELFEDPEFPPTDSSLFYSHRPDRRFEWRRPGEIVDNPQLFVEGFSRFDVQQGELGDCWLLAAVANLTLYRRLFFQIVPDDQGFDENYAGIFHFRFWQYGRWIDVVIDDRLPTYRGELVFLHSTEANEFWSALLEKAYAKLHGSYEALKGGSTCEAMEDFTGGVTEMYELDAAPPNLFKIISKAYERWSLMGCSIEPDPDVLEAQTPEGLIRGHAYSITKVQYVNITTPNVSGKIPLLRLRNPWGNESEWNGAWSDHSPEWHYISDSDKEELGLNFDADGEFWMSFKDFQQHFNRIEICNLNPDSLAEDELTEGRNKKWVMSVFEGEWVRGVTAGGCRNFLDTFSHNPQYRVTLDEVDEGDDDDKCTLIVALMQKNRRQMRRSVGPDLLTIGFAIYYLPYPDRAPKPLDLNFFKYNASVARSPSFINLREVSCRFKLPRGTYCIVPSTFDPNEEGEFLLRVFSEHQNNMEENDQQIGLVSEPVPEPTLEEKKENDAIFKLFKNIAGKDEEVDWKELKEILDHYTRKEEPPVAKTLEGVRAAPEVTHPSSDQNNESNVFTAILSLLCGALCKDTPFADVLPQDIALNETPLETQNRGFSKDVCRSMIAMLDVDRTGKLNFEEFKRLWESIRHWKSIFKQHDVNESGTLTGFELRNALTSAGYSLNNHILNILMHRYGNKSNEIEFDDFIMCAVKLKIMIELFKQVASPDADAATFNLSDWIENTLYC
ncbi:calpain-A isoform X3 [Tribolium castaneum]|uniref:calpain-A isoform X3 n=1 Tax=Tribolium castaneum TaxID=7070 RepID=UPI00077DD348|nr:PREDICTED: calpain-A isoform X3 [Tribolium castaneum]|eukprot:XP_015833872.1 PREDICTED: calpain-A isoform X3 [Tribolium castaneum]